MMNPLRTLLLLAGMLMLAASALAVDTYQYVIDANSPQFIVTDLVYEEGDQILIQAQGAMRQGADRNVFNGWFDPSGLGSVQRPDQPLENGPFGALIAQYSSTVGGEFMLGELADLTVQPGEIGRELQIGVNMSANDLSVAEGAFLVHITRYQSDEVNTTTVTLDRDSPRPLLTGVDVSPGDQVLVIAQGVVNSSTPGEMTQGWFDASGVAKLNRVGQLIDDMAFGSLLGSFSGSLGGAFFIGDRGFWASQSGGGRGELSLVLNMSADNQAALVGELKVHILHIPAGGVSAVPEDGVPGAQAIVSVDNYPNPFNPMTTVRFELGRPQEVRVSIVNVAGDLVKTLAQGTYGAGKHHLRWDGRDSRGRSQASGIYFLRLDTDEAVQTHKLTLVR